MIKFAIGILVGAGLGWYYESRITEGLKKVNEKTGVLDE